jgi:hypothetical protein
VTLGQRWIGNVTIIDIDGRVTDDDDADILLRDTLKGLVTHGRLSLLVNLEGVPSIDSAALGPLRPHTPVRHGRVAGSPGVRSLEAVHEPHEPGTWPACAVRFSTPGVARPAARVSRREVVWPEVRRFDEPRGHLRNGVGEILRVARARQNANLGRHERRGAALE